jgi:predicted hydrocarbon binding protein
MMMAIEESGLYYINKMARIWVQSIEETIGSEAMKAVYEAAGVPLQYYPPPNNFAKAFDFAYFSALNEAVEQLYGARGGRGLIVHAGKAMFAAGNAEFSSMFGISDLAFKAIPLKAKLKLGLVAMAETFSKFTDQRSTVEDSGDHYIYTIHQCPICWGRRSARPICYGAISIISEGLYRTSAGQTFPLEEVTCHAAGDEACVIHIGKEPLTT